MLENLIGSFISVGPVLSLRIKLDGKAGEPVPQCEYLRFEDVNRVPVLLEHRLTYARAGRVSMITRYVYVFETYIPAGWLPISFDSVQESYEFIDRDDKPDVVYFKQHYSVQRMFVGTAMWVYRYREKLAHRYG